MNTLSVLLLCGRQQMALTLKKRTLLPATSLLHMRQKRSRFYSSNSSIVFDSSVTPLHIEKILIANRGEIACRVIKTAKKLGVKTVAVYSEADANSRHVFLADEAYNIGPAPSAESYLRGDKILQVAKETNAQAIHPGYGFLSENAAFAQSCKDIGVEFMGPPPSAITQMGSKSVSKEIMIAAGVPCVGGYHGKNQDAAFLEAEADKIGYPVLIKAIAGGGGKGMRIVTEKKEFQQLLESAKRESLKSFKDDNVLVEKYMTNPRHIEIQVFADKHGNCVYLFERDCSVQRRHQKIIEEAPAPGISDEMRKEIGEAAVRAAKAVNYVGAGTVEFIMDSNQNFFFMEMNTRLQVEHPVTEYITKQDLVDWQIQVASGLPLPLSQDELKIHGHSFEARVYAEDPNNNFLPVAGTLEHLKPPQESQYIRVDTGVDQGDTVGVFYDPMIAKLIVWGDNRTVALRRLVKALGEYQVCGLSTNIRLVTDIAKHPEFIAGNVETGFIEKHKKDILNTSNTIPAQVYAEIAVASHLRKIAITRTSATSHLNFPFRLNGNYTKTVKVKRSVSRKNNSGNDNLETPVNVQITFNNADTFVVDVNHAQNNNSDNSIDNFTIRNASYDVHTNRFTCFYHGNRSAADIVFSQLEHQIHYFDKNHGTHYITEAFLPGFLQTAEASIDLSALIAPMMGTVERVLCKVGDSVTKNQALVIISSMKTEHVLKAPTDGTVSSVSVGPGRIVHKNELLIKF